MKNFYCSNYWKLIQVKKFHIFSTDEIYFTMKVKLIMVHTHHDYTDIIKTNYCVANVLYTQPENKYIATEHA